MRSSSYPASQRLQQGCGGRHGGRHDFEVLARDLSPLKKPTYVGLKAERTGFERNGVVLSNRRKRLLNNDLCARPELA